MKTGRGRTRNRACSRDWPIQRRRHLAHRLLQRYTRVGATETEVSLRASNEATLAMLDTLGPLYRAQSLYGDGAEAGYRGQIGRGAAIPHALANNVTFQAGDVLVTGAGVPMWGYNSELERTMVLGRRERLVKRHQRQESWNHKACPEQSQRGTETQYIQKTRSYNE